VNRKSIKHNSRQLFSKILLVIFFIIAAFVANAQTEVQDTVAIVEETDAPKADVEENNDKQKEYFQQKAPGDNFTVQQRQVSDKAIK
jgi:hypothetical protein